MLITLPDYQRIYSIAHAVLKSENSDTNKSCLFYNYCGAYILNNHYKINAKVHSGFAAYHLGVEKILGFGSIDDGKLKSSEYEFHSWVEADDWLIDFMAPEFPNIMLYNGCCSPIPRKMMQSRLANMADGPDELKESGDFLVIPDMELTKSLAGHLESRPAFVDLVDICNQWFNKKPNKMHKSISISNGKGQLNQVSLSGIKPIVGRW
ncbi:DUF2026 domain-containing protein [Shewanella baltica]|uniref:DUF2026 domain-containing protein n=1 Tax=Shewanella baltica TaxID=62322 RepID=UPI00217E2D72|nr:DUF2026 domain-containing protein [Shewanella baltica]MCS6120238.1 DUF2026 domain-containing protein [Shewanella baltica]